MLEVHKLQRVQFGSTWPAGKQVIMQTGTYVYLWKADLIPTIVAALREHAKGPCEPGAGGLVFSSPDGRVHLRDRTEKVEQVEVLVFANLDETEGPPMITERTNCSYWMPRFEANGIADSLQAVYDDLQRMEASRDGSGVTFRLER
jgi:hypothetical protein